MRTPLHTAVVNEEVLIVHQLIMQGVKIDEIDFNGATALHLATETKNFEICKILLSAGADSFAEDANGITPRHLAVRSNNVNIVQLFIDATGNVNKKDACGFTFLHLAAEWGNTNIVRFVISAGGDVNATTTTKVTPLLQAIKSENLNVLKLLIARGAIADFVDHSKDTLLHNTVSDLNSARALKLLIDCGVDVHARNELGNTLLHTVAGKNCDVDILKLLIDSGADVNAKNLEGNTPLHLAANHQRTRNVKMLIASGADVNLKNDHDETPLNILVHSLNSSGFHRIKEPIMETTRLLIDAGVDVNSKNVSGCTFFYYAVRFFADVSFLRCLIEAGADANTINNRGRSPLMMICDGFSQKKNKTEWAKILIEHTNINLCDKNEKNIVSYILKSPTSKCVRDIVCKSLVEHVAKWKILGLEIDRSLIETITMDKQYNDHFMSCVKELEKAKSTELQKCWVTFFNLLIDDKTKLVKYAGNKFLMKDLKKNANQFPIFKTSMLNNMKKGAAGRALFDEASNNLSYHLPIFDRNHLVIRNVLDALQEHDWKSLCDKKRYRVN